MVSVENTRLWPPGGRVVGGVGGRGGFVGGTLVVVGGRGGVVVVPPERGPLVVGGAVVVLVGPFVGTVVVAPSWGRVVDGDSGFAPGEPSAPATASLGAASAKCAAPASGSDALPRSGTAGAQATANSAKTIATPGRRGILGLVTRFELHSRAPWRLSLQCRAIGGLTSRLEQLSLARRRPRSKV